MYLKIKYDQFLKSINEAYDDVSLDMIKKNIKKLESYPTYDNKKVIDNYTYLNFKTNDDWFIWSDIKVFDNEDGTEIGRSSYGKLIETSSLKATIDVRSDKRRNNIASNIYEWIEELTGYILQPDIPHSKSAQSLWNNPNRNFGEKINKPNKK